MDTKLTLNLDKAIIEMAKRYAKSKQVSLSKLIEAYLSSLVDKREMDLSTTPLVDSLSGVIALEGNSTSDYTDYLEEKYR